MLSKCSLLDNLLNIDGPKIDCEQKNVKLVIYKFRLFNIST